MESLTFSYILTTIGGEPFTQREPGDPNNTRGKKDDPNPATPPDEIPTHPKPPIQEPPPVY